MAVELSADSPLWPVWQYMGHDWPGLDETRMARLAEACLTVSGSLQASHHDALRSATWLATQAEGRSFEDFMAYWSAPDGPQQVLDDAAVAVRLTAHAVNVWTGIVLRLKLDVLDVLDAVLRDLDAVGGRALTGEQWRECVRSTALAHKPAVDRLFEQAVASLREA